MPYQRLATTGSQGYRMLLAGGRVSWDLHTRGLESQLNPVD